MEKRIHSQLNCPPQKNDIMPKAVAMSNMLKHGNKPATSA